MAQKTVVFSDISNEPLEDDDHVRLVVNDHPSLQGSPVSLDVSRKEAEALETTKLDLVMVDVFAPDQPKRTVVMEATKFNALYKNADLSDIIARAPKIAAQIAANMPRKRVAKAGGATSGGDKRDYKSPEWAGVEHRGRVTEAEAAWVRENLDQANANRAREGQDPIDPANEKMKNRYGF